MRRHALFSLGLGLLGLGSLGLGLATASMPAQAAMVALPMAAAPQSSIVKVGYYCSPGFTASYGRCIATASSDEVELFLNEPGGYDQGEAPPPPAPRLIRKHRRHALALHDRY